MYTYATMILRDPKFVLRSQKGVQMEKYGLGMIERKKRRKAKKRGTMVEKKPGRWQNRAQPRRLFNHRRTKLKD